MIALKNVTKVYQGPGGDLVALDDISLEVQEGDFVAVMGTSGSGKTTLLSVIGAMNPPTTGEVLIDGLDLYALSGEKLADFRREYVGFVFQQSQLIPYLSAIENVMVPLVVSDSPGSRLQIAAKALGSVGLKERMLQLPDHLSGGEQGRVAIARAVVNNPPILLADEPTGNLDSRTGEEIMRQLRALNEQGRTIVMATHSAEAAGFARRVIVLRDGRIVEERQGAFASPPLDLNIEVLSTAGSTHGQWAEQAELAEKEAGEADEEPDEYGDWLVISLVTIVAAVILFFLLFVVDSGEIWQHVH